MSTIRLQIDSLDAKIANLQELFGHDNVYEGPIDLDIEDDLPAGNADITADNSPAGGAFLVGGTFPGRVFFACAGLPDGGAVGMRHS